MLMQFATLTVLCALRALDTRRQSWLIAAATTVAVGFGTKYPGGLFLLPVALAAIFPGGLLSEGEVAAAHQ